MVNEVTKILPVDELDIQGVQDWLESMALEGYFLDDTTGLWWHFNGGEPKKVRYRVDPDVKKKRKTEAEKKEDFEAMGWHYVLTRPEYHIFMADDPDTEELHTDRRVEGMALEKMEKRLKVENISLVMAIILPYFISNTSRMKLITDIRYPLISLTSEGNMLVIIHLLLIAYMIKRGFSLKRIRALRRNLEEGSESGKKRTNTKRFRSFGNLVYLSLLCFYIFIMFTSCESVDGPEYVQNPGEILMLENLESGKIIPNTEKTRNNNNWWVDKDWNLLLKKKYTIHQRCLLEGRTKNGELDPVKLNAEYYKLRTRGMADSLYREMTEKYVSTVPDGTTRVLAAGTYLDACTIGVMEENQILVGQQGDVVIYVVYNGDENIEENAQKIGKLMLEVPRLSQ